jgi:hypothetical protein
VRKLVVPILRRDTRVLRSIRFNELNGGADLLIIPIGTPVQWRNCGGGGASAPSDNFLRDKGIILTPQIIQQYK